ncbi:hypothetical protein PR048_003206 [Dryococelus australis]|uniref:Uncharacterized protein n=1 Tax=Dryococelus australis TaxID=614101 RepID=A0ABQ9IME0_9NEOP|nr:hypothetical protein PR048_003206 [Dryococelus australis]
MDKAMRSMAMLILHKAEGHTTCIQEAYTSRYGVVDVPKLSIPRCLNIRSQFLQILRQGSSRDRAADTIPHELIPVAVELWRGRAETTWPPRELSEVPVMKIKGDRASYEIAPHAMTPGRLDARHATANRSSLALPAPFALEDALVVQRQRRKWGSSTEHYLLPFRTAPTSFGRGITAVCSDVVLRVYSLRSCNRLLIVLALAGCCWRVWSSTGMKGRGKWESPEKTHRPKPSSGTIPIRENPVTRIALVGGDPTIRPLSNASQLIEAKSNLEELLPTQQHESQNGQHAHTGRGGRWLRSPVCTAVWPVLAAINCAAEDRARWRSGNSLDSHLVGPGFDSGLGLPDFDLPWFPEITPGACWDGSLTNTMAHTLPPPHPAHHASKRGGRCRCSAGFLGDLPFPPPLYSGASPFLPHSTFTLEMGFACANVISWNAKSWDTEQRNRYIPERRDSREMTLTCYKNNIFLQRVTCLELERWNALHERNCLLHPYFTGSEYHSVIQVVYVEIFLHVKLGGRIHNAFRCAHFERLLYVNQGFQKCSVYREEQPVLHAEHCHEALLPVLGVLERPCRRVAKWATRWTVLAKYGLGFFGGDPHTRVNGPVGSRRKQQQSCRRRCLPLAVLDIVAKSRPGGILPCPATQIVSEEICEVSMGQRWNERVGKWEIPEKTRRPAASFRTIPTCEESGSNSAGNRTWFTQVLLTILEPVLRTCAQDESQPTSSQVCGFDRRRILLEVVQAENMAHYPDGFSRCTPASLATEFHLSSAHISYHLIYFPCVPLGQCPNSLDVHTCAYLSLSDVVTGVRTASEVYYSPPDDIRILKRLKRPTVYITPPAYLSWPPWRPTRLVCSRLVLSSGRLLAPIQAIHKGTWHIRVSFVFATRPPALSDWPEFVASSAGCMEVDTFQARSMSSRLWLLLTVREYVQTAHRREYQTLLTPSAYSRCKSENSSLGNGIWSKRCILKRGSYRGYTGARYRSAIAATVGCRSGWTEEQNHMPTRLTARRSHHVDKGYSGRHLTSRSSETTTSTCARQLLEMAWRETAPPLPRRAGGWFGDHSGTLSVPFNHCRGLGQLRLAIGMQDTSHLRVLRFRSVRDLPRSVNFLQSHAHVLHLDLKWRQKFSLTSYRRVKADKSNTLRIRVALYSGVIPWHAGVFFMNRGRCGIILVTAWLHILAKKAKFVETRAEKMRLDCSPPTKANWVRPLAGQPPDIRKWESCRTMALVDGFSRGYSKSFVRIRPVFEATEAAIRDGSGFTLYREILVPLDFLLRFQTLQPLINRRIVQDHRKRMSHTDLEILARASAPSDICADPSSEMSTMQQRAQLQYKGQCVPGRRAIAVGLKDSVKPVPYRKNNHQDGPRTSEEKAEHLKLSCVRSPKKSTARRSTVSCRRLKVRIIYQIISRSEANNAEAARWGEKKEENNFLVEIRLMSQFVCGGSLASFLHSRVGRHPRRRWQARTSRPRRRRFNISFIVAATRCASRR